MCAELSPSQSRTLERLESLLPAGTTFVMWTAAGLGRSTVLTEAGHHLGGAIVTLKDVLDARQGQHPLAIEEPFAELILAALEKHDLVLIDDLHVIEHIVGSCSFHYPRAGVLDALLTAVCTYAGQTDKKLVFGHDGRAPAPIDRRCYYVGFDEFGEEDYASLLTVLAPAGAQNLDVSKIYRFAPRLNAHQIKGACSVLAQCGNLDTESFITYLLEHRLASNVALSNVEQVDLRDLKGVDHILHALEAHVVVPFEHDELARELSLTPKKGVLLYGPPGTGKTTIGRALAHRLRGKFFLIDGTFITGTSQFYLRVKQVFEAAKANAPSIIFIDDSDVICESDEDMGFYRYLLTKLDGLESEGQGTVCVMMTAMDVGKLPRALIRSGRMELWLEMSLPTEEARQKILRHWIARLPESLQQVDLGRLTEETAGFTGADIRRLAEDSKNLYAYDRAYEVPAVSPTDYFLRAIETVRANQQKRVQAEAGIKQQRAGPRFRSHFSVDEDDDGPVCD